VLPGERRLHRECCAVAVVASAASPVCHRTPSHFVEINAGVS
jgi:hypothetical protein